MADTGAWLQTVPPMGLCVTPLFLCFLGISTITILRQCWQLKEVSQGGKSTHDTGLTDKTAQGQHQWELCRPA